MPSTGSLTDLARPISAAARPATHLVAALFAAFLGLFILWGAGFAQTSAVHNAAHDTRHSNAFPCH
jgi:cobalt transporter subunit CbtB